MNWKISRPTAAGVAILVLTFACGLAAEERQLEDPSLIHNSDFKDRGTDAQQPANYQIIGDAEYRYLGDPRKDMTDWGIALQSGKHIHGSGPFAGTVSQTVNGIDSSKGRWFRFSFRGLPQDGFRVTDDDLYMKAEFFRGAEHNALDGKEKKLYPIVEEARKDMTANGIRHTGGAAVWRTYALDFYLPFPQVDQIKLTVGSGHGAAESGNDSALFVTDFSLTRIPDPRGDATTQGVINASAEVHPTGKLIPLGGRWFYEAADGETEAPKKFDYANADRLLYQDDIYTAPFAGNMTATLKVGYKDLAGNIADKDQPVLDNVTVTFDGDEMIIHTKGIPNHPTGKFPEEGGRRGNPSYIQEQDSTYYLPVNPKINMQHFALGPDSSNRALPMGPIGIAVNGVVFFNPFDAGGTDATDMMDRCCGHPNPDNQYHYHKYPICINSPWSDEGKAHSPLIGFAFDGFPIYGPYESADVMAKDVKGDNALNDFNMHFDKDRGWHYHVTPGKYPYIIGGYWGAEDDHDRQRPRHPRGGMSGPNGNGAGGRPPFGPPPGPPPDGQ